DELRELFAQHGTVVSVQVVEDRETGRSRGFAFVEMSDGADEAINNLNGAQFQGRTLTVNEPRPREDRPRSGGGRGGYGSGRGGAAWFRSRSWRTARRAARAASPLSRCPMAPTRPSTT